MKSCWSHLKNRLVETFWIANSLPLMFKHNTTNTKKVHNNDHSVIIIYLFISRSTFEAWLLERHLFVLVLSSSSLALTWGLVALNSLSAGSTPTSNLLSLNPLTKVCVVLCFWVFSAQTLCLETLVSLKKCCLCCRKWWEGWEKIVAKFWWVQFGATEGCHKWVLLRKHSVWAWWESSKCCLQRKTW